MFIRLFDIQGGKVIPSEHCYQISWLKEIIKDYPANYGSVFGYLQYMSSRNPDDNPYIALPEEDRESTILYDLKPDFDVEDEQIQEALERCRKMSETPKYKAWIAMKIQIDRLVQWLAETVPFSGKDGNIKDIKDTMKEMPALQAAYNKLESEMLEETKNMNRGNRDLGYDAN